MQSVPKMEDLIPLIKERLEAGQEVCISPRGTSMLPMLRQGIDAVELSAPPQTLRKYDLPLYCNSDGKYLLHRIVAVDEKNCYCMGDNTYVRETVAPVRVIAVVTAFRRGQRRISTDAWHYRLYCRIWVGSFPLRKFLKRALGWIKRHIAK